MLDPVAHDRQIALTHEGKMRRILILIDAAVSP